MDSTIRKRFGEAFATHPSQREEWGTPFLLAALAVEPVAWTSDKHAMDRARANVCPPPFAARRMGHPHGDGSVQCLAVMYHYVCGRDSQVPAGVLGLDVDAFENQLDRLCRDLAPTDWPSLHAWMQGRGRLPERCFLLTFDDGLADHERVVSPMLERRGLRGVFFVPGAILEAQEMLSAHAIHVLLATLGERRFHEALHDYLRSHAPHTDWETAYSKEEARRVYHYELGFRAELKYLLTMVLPMDLRQAAVRELFEQHVGSMARWSRSWYLDRSALARLASQGHTIGGHGYRHEPLARLTPQEQEADVRRAGASLQTLPGSEGRPFSYPYGSVDENTTAGVARAGFAGAFTTRPGWITRRCDPLRLPRVDTIELNAFLESEMACALV